jgi:hypothetical protein
VKGAWNKKKKKKKEKKTNLERNVASFKMDRKLK